MDFGIVNYFKEGMKGNKLSYVILYSNDEDKNYMETSVIIPTELVGSLDEALERFGDRYEPEDIYTPKEDYWIEFSVYKTIQIEDFKYVDERTIKINDIYLSYSELFKDDFIGVVHQLKHDKEFMENLEKSNFSKDYYMKYFENSEAYKVYRRCVTNYLRDKGIDLEGVSSEEFKEEHEKLTKKELINKLYIEKIKQKTNQRGW